MKVTKVPNFSEYSIIIYKKCDAISLGESGLTDLATYMIDELVESGHCAGSLKAVIQLPKKDS